VATKPATGVALMATFSLLLAEGFGALSALQLAQKHYFKCAIAGL
jgi:hypothetical protein